MLRQKADRSWPADKVARWQIDRLVPAARNARLHDEAQVAQIAASIKEWGWTVPVLVDEKANIIAGHGRVLAARLLGLDQVPVMVARGWSQADKRAYALADNKLAIEAGWNDELLIAELRDLAERCGTLVELTGFSLDELADMTLSADAESPEPRTSRALNAAVTYEMVFDDEAQQERFFELLRLVKTQFPDEETIGAQLAAFALSHAQ